MITGYNTDVPYEGKTYHVQTEDKGVANPTIESLIYVGGEILAAIRSSYADLVHRGKCDEKDVTKRLEAQHKRVIREIREGRHDPEGLRPIGEGLITDRPLDEVVLAYIGELLEAEDLELAPLAEVGVEAGGDCRLQLMARGNLTGRPLRHVDVVFRLERQAGDRHELFREKTGIDGIVRARFPIPASDADNATLVAEMSTERGAVRWEHRIGAPAGGA